MKRLLLLFSLLFTLAVSAQTYNPSLHTVTNKALGIAQANPTDARSYFYDASLFVYRPYQSTAEVLSYLNIAKYRTGQFPIYINSGGILTGAVFAGGTVSQYWFKDGVADANLVVNLGANLISSQLTNWNTAFSWGNHAGLYPLLSGHYVNPSWIDSLSYSKISGLNLNTVTNAGNSTTNDIIANSFVSQIGTRAWASLSRANDAGILNGRLNLFSQYGFYSSLYPAAGSNSISTLPGSGGVLLSSINGYTADTVGNVNIPLTWSGTVAQMRNLSASDVSKYNIFQTTDYDGINFPFIWKPNNLEIEDSGIIVKGINPGSFVRQFSPLTVKPEFWGAVADGTTDCYNATMHAISYIGLEGTVVWGVGRYYYSKPSTTGGLTLPQNAVGISLIGQGQGRTIIKLSANVPRFLDMPGIRSTSVINTYKNITVKGFTVDANNVKGSSYGLPIVATSAATAPGGGGYVTINVADNSSYLSTGGIALLPETNTGTAKSQYKRFRVPAGSSTTLQIALNAGETIAIGDTIKGASHDPVVIGTYGGAFYDVNSGNVVTDNINIEDIDGINISTEPPYIARKLQWTKRIGIGLDTWANTYAGSSVIKMTNINMRRVRLFGGSEGIGIFSSPFPAPSNVFFDKILLEDCYHNTLIRPSFVFESYNFLLGNTGFGKDVTLNRCYGEGSSDVGVEMDGFMNAKQQNVNIKNSFGSGYFHKNWNVPSNYETGSLSSPLASGINTSVTSLAVAAIPASAPLKGYISIGNELLYYNVSNASATSMTVVRGLNNTVAATHNTGDPVYFLEVDKANLTYENCTYENDTLQGNNLNVNGWLEYSAAGNTNMYPLSNIKIRNSSYVRKTKDGTFYQTGEAILFSGQNSLVDIDNFSVNINGINRPVSDAATSQQIQIENTGYDATGTVPPTNVRINNLGINVNANLDTTNAGNNTRLYGIALLKGNFYIDWHSLRMNYNLGNTSNNTQATGILTGFASTPNIINGNINTYKFSSSGNATPVPLRTNNATTIGRLNYTNVDLSDMKFLADSANTFYVPYQLDAANVKNVYIGEVKPPTNQILQTATEQKHRVTVNGNYNVKFDDKYVGFFNLGSTLFTATLPTVATANANVKPNYGAEIEIADESGAAASFNVTIAAAPGETINGSPSVTITKNYGGYKLKAVPSGWQILSTIENTDYNTVSQVINYERFRRYWLGNSYHMVSEAGGTGTTRSFDIGTTGRLLVFNPLNVGNSLYDFAHGAPGGGGNQNFLSLSGNNSFSSGVTNEHSIISSINQSGSAGYRAYYASINQQALGSGVHELINLGLNNGINGLGTHSPKFTVNNNGDGYFAGSVGIGVNGTSSSSLLELNSTTQGFRLPRMTTAQRDSIGSPVIGLNLHNLDTKKVNYFDGTVWRVVIASTDVAPTNGQLLIGNAGEYSVSTPTGINGVIVTPGAGSLTFKADTGSSFISSKYYRQKGLDSIAAVIAGAGYLTTTTGDSRYTFEKVLNNGSSLLTTHTADGGNHDFTWNNFNYYGLTGTTIQLLGKNAVNPGIVLATMDFAGTNPLYRLNIGATVSNNDAPINLSQSYFNIGNVAGEPPTPASGGVLFVQGGSLKYKGSSGTVTTLAAP